MTDEFTRDPERDPILAAALRGALGDPPAGEVDWEGMRGRISARAEMPLARARRAQRGGFGGRFRSLVPLAAAAGIAAAALAVTLQPDRAPALTPEEQALVNEIAETAVPEPVAPLLSGEAAREAFLEASSGS